MTIIIPKATAAKANDALRKVFENFLYPRIESAMRQNIEAHLAWMVMQPQMYVNAKLETEPALKLTRITLEISHTPIAPLNPTKN